MAVSEPKGVPQFMKGLLKGPEVKEFLIVWPTVKALPKSMIGEDGQTSSNEGQPKDKIKPGAVKILTGDPKPERSGVRTLGQMGQKGLGLPLTTQGVKSKGREAQGRA